jgi:hypothetical protein
MLKGILKLSILAGCFSLASVAATAQEVVHALTGSVVSIDSSAMAITVFTDKHTQVLFKDMTNSHAPAGFDKTIRIDPAATDTSKKVGAYVIVFYFGGGDIQSVVALRSLGSGPFTQGSGTVVKFDAKEHSISVKDDSGAVASYKITSDTVAETGFGAVGGLKFHAEKGDQVRITASTVDGTATALFISAM